MRARQSLSSGRLALPDRWLMTDARTAATLATSLRALPRGAGVIFRHYHLLPAERRAAFARVLRLARARGLVVALASGARQARAWGADVCYGPPELLARGPALTRLTTAHDLTEIGRAAAARAGAVLLSPVLPTRSHPGAPTLGPVRFLLLAARSPVPVIALGGMSRRSARRLPGAAWAAIDGLEKKARIPKDS